MSRVGEFLRRLFCRVFDHTEPESADVVRDCLRNNLPPNLKLGPVRGTVSCAVCGEMIDIRLEDE